MCEIVFVFFLSRGGGVFKNVMFVTLFLSVRPSVRPSVTLDLQKMRNREIEPFYKKGGIIARVEYEYYRGTGKCSMLLLF